MSVNRGRQIYPVCSGGACASNRKAIDCTQGTCFVPDSRTIDSEVYRHYKPKPGPQRITGVSGLRYASQVE